MRLLPERIGRIRDTLSPLLEVYADLERFIQGVYPYERIRDGLGPEAYDAAYQRGTALSLEEAVAHVLAVAEAVEGAAAEGGQDGDSPAS